MFVDIMSKIIHIIESIELNADESLKAINDQ